MSNLDLWISEITAYPVKSTAGWRQGEAEVTARGLAFDRQWMLVDEDGTCITARDLPALLQIGATVKAGCLQLQAPNMPDLSLPIPSGSQVLTSVTVWDDQCDALGFESTIDDWFARYLGRSCHLVYMPDTTVRPVDGGDPAGPQVGFADSHPLLLIGAASLDDLNSRSPEPVSMRQFRPNLVVEGAAPFAEDDWGRIQIGDVTFVAGDGCERCVLTTIDPDTTIKHDKQEPLRTLSTYRRRGQGAPYFGQYLIPETGGIIREGDQLEVL
jgi:hypothetical protein